MTEELAPGSSFTSRQKSCHACVKGKRGCDKQHPVCSRCKEKRIQCIYAKRTHAQAFDEFDSVELDMSWAEPDALSALSNFVYDVPPSLAPPITTPDFQSLSTLDAFIDPFLTFSENQAVPSGDMQLINNAAESFAQQQEKDQPLNKFDYGPMADLCVQYEPWHVYDPNTKAHFLIKTIKAYPGTFARDNGTPWMHRYLYKDQMPSSIQACFTVSTLYSNMNTSNKTSVFRVFCQSLHELKQHPLANTPQEKLARTQALFIYQIIALFDGDVTLRSNADRNMTLLQDWLDELCKIRENLKTPEHMDDPSPPRSWEWWIFAESVRRTIVIAYAFLGLWSIMSKNYDSEFFGAWKYLHCWTLSRSLWEAPSSFEFFRAWKPYPVIDNFDFENFVKTGRPVDVDEFCQVLLVAYMGVDETKQFMDKGCIC